MEFITGHLTVDFNQPISLAQVLTPQIEDAEGKLNPTSQPNAYFAPPFRADPVRAGQFVGSTALGGALNFMNLHLVPAEARTAIAAITDAVRRLT